MRTYRLDIDWDLLGQQKSYLLQLIQADCTAGGLTKYGEYSIDDHPLDGLVQMIDAIQDQGESAGETVYSEEDE
jgi:hypothetical protein